MGDEQMGAILAEFKGLKAQMKEQNEALSARIKALESTIATLNESVSKLDSERISKDLDALKQSVQNIKIDDKALKQFTRLVYLKMI